MEWVGRIFAVSLVMFMPGVLGGLLDRRWATNFIGPLGFLLGFVAGTALLIVLATSQSSGKRKRR